MSCTVQALRPRARWRGLVVVAASLPFLAVTAAAAQGAGQGGDTSPPRTVSWYAANPQSRARVELACLDDPGRLGSNPDCINAHRAGVNVALEAARKHLGSALNPNTTAFWSADPETRQSKLIMCRRNPELDNCDTAKRSLMIEAGTASKR